MFVLSIFYISFSIFLFSLLAKKTVPDVLKNKIKVGSFYLYIYCTAASTSQTIEWLTQGITNCKDFIFSDKTVWCITCLFYGHSTDVNIKMIFFFLFLRSLKSLGGWPKSLSLKCNQR